MKEARIPIVSLDDCVDAHREVLNANIDSTVVCTGLPNGGIGACQVWRAVGSHKKKTRNN